MTNKKKPLAENTVDAIPDWESAWVALFPDTPQPDWEHTWAAMSQEERKRLQDELPEGMEKDWPEMSIRQKVGYSLLTKHFQHFRSDVVAKGEAAIAEMKATMVQADAYQAALLEVLPPPEDGIGNRIKERRDELRLNVEELARLTKEYDFAVKKGISPSTLRRYEYRTGGFKPGAREICLLCDALDISADWLVRGVRRSNGNEPAQEAFNAFMDAVKKIIATQNNPPDSVTQSKGNQRTQYIECEDQRLERLRRAKLPEK